LLLIISAYSTAGVPPLRIWQVHRSANGITPTRRDCESNSAARIFPIRSPLLALSTDGISPIQRWQREHRL